MRIDKTIFYKLSIITILKQIIFKKNYKQRIRTRRLYIPVFARLFAFLFLPQKTCTLKKITLDHLNFEKREKKNHFSTTQKTLFFLQLISCNFCVMTQLKKECSSTASVALHRGNNWRLLVEPSDISLTKSQFPLTDLETLKQHTRCCILSHKGTQQQLTMLHVLALYSVIVILGRSKDSAKKFLFLLLCKLKE